MGWLLKRSHLFLLQPFAGCIFNATDGFFMEKIVDSACNFAILVYSMCVAPKGSRGIRLWLTMEVRL